MSDGAPAIIWRARLAAKLLWEGGDRTGPVVAGDRIEGRIDDVGAIVLNVGAAEQGEER